MSRLTGTQGVRLGGVGVRKRRKKREKSHVSILWSPQKAARCPVGGLVAGVRWVSGGVQWVSTVIYSAFGGCGYSGVTAQLGGPWGELSAVAVHLGLHLGVCQCVSAVTSGSVARLRVCLLCKVRPRREGQKWPPGAFTSSLLHRA